MRSNIVQYRSATERHDNFKIDCIILQHPFFLAESDWIPVPSNFHINIVHGKTDDLDSGPGKELSVLSESW
jgi:hypothetical protein